MGFCRWCREAGRQVFTEPDNATLDVSRVFGVPFAIVSSAVFLALAIYSVAWLRQPLDYIAFGTGLSTVWGVFALGVGVNDAVKRPQRPRP